MPTTIQIKAAAEVPKAAGDSLGPQYTLALPSGAYATYVEFAFECEYQQGANSPSKSLAGLGAGAFAITYRAGGLTKPAPLRTFFPSPGGVAGMYRMICALTDPLSALIDMTVTVTRTFNNKTETAKATITASGVKPM